MNIRKFKMEIFIPKDYLNELRKELAKVNVGIIGNYHNCMSISKVVGTWTPVDGANPFEGEIGELSIEEEYKIEIVCNENVVKDAIKVLNRIHPYEEPVYNIIPLVNSYFK